MRRIEFNYKNQAVLPLTDGPDLDFGIRLSEFIAYLNETAQLLGATDPLIELHIPDHAEWEVRFEMYRSVTPAEKAELQAREAATHEEWERRYYESLKKKFEGEPKT